MQPTTVKRPADPPTEDTPPEKRRRSAEPQTEPLLPERGDRLKIVINTGRTEEDIDPVRILTNRATGETGFAFAAEAKKLGGLDPIFRTLR